MSCTSQRLISELVKSSRWQAYEWGLVDVSVQSADALSVTVGPYSMVELQARFQVPVLQITERKKKTINNKQ